MHFLKSTNLFLVLLLSSPIYLGAEDKSIVSEDRLNLFEYSDEQNKENSEKLKKDWINPINLSYSKNYGEIFDTTKSMINISQPIFKSGGIYKAIKYADASYKFNTIDIEIQRKEIIKKATTLLFNLHIIDLNIQRDEILLDNANIDVIRKKEQVLNGFLDTSFLDNAILKANIIKNTLAELKFQKEELNNNFSNIASGNYQSFELPILKLANEEVFLERNIQLSKSKADIEQKNYYKDITVSKYLPTVNANFDYSKFHDIDTKDTRLDDSVQNYGISVVMPLDVRVFNDIEAQKINYLKAKLDLKNKILEEENFYKTKIAKIKMLSDKKRIAKDDYELYNSLLEVIIEEKNAELKTQSDVDTLQNSQKIKTIELKIFNLQEQIELLEIYSRIS